MKTIKSKFSIIYIRYFFLLIALSVTGFISGCKTPVRPQKTKYGPPKADYSKIKNSESNSQTAINLFSKIKSFLF
jgi:hypothetical protein